MLRLYRIPFSTNVERVELALAFKGLSAEDVWIDPSDRSELVALTGQDLVPVLEHDGVLITDSPVILEHLEAHFPEPPMFPRDEARAAEVRVFADWFNRVWKLAPNAIADEAGDPAPHWETLQRHLGVFEGLLAGRKFLFGEYGVADMIAWPFLRYGAHIDPADDERFHQVLHEGQNLDAHPRIRSWIDAVDAQRR